MLALDKFNEESFVHGCILAHNSKNQEELEESFEEVEKEPQGHLLAPFIKMAIKFDGYSETLLNRNMCTETCPCYQMDIQNVTGQNATEEGKDEH